MIEQLTNFAVSIAWQSTLALAIGLLAARLCKRRPARADGLLVASVLAAMAAPVGTFAVRELGWGLFEQPPAVASVAALDAAVPIPDDQPVASSPTASVTSEATPPPQFAQADPSAPIESSLAASRFEELSIDQPTAQPSLAAAAPSALTSQPSDPAYFSWFTAACAMLVTIWGVLSLLSLFRLLEAAWAGRRLLATSLPVTDRRVARTLRVAAERLALDVSVEARTSSLIHCPVIWCWSRRPIVLLPVSFTSQTNESVWLGIFCHELAHWKRRDQLSSLVVELLCCLLPWQPLARWAYRHHAQLAELACDEWVLAAGPSAESYAESLLDLAPQPGARLALAVLRTRTGLGGRIRHILAIGRARPALGRRWVVAVAGATVTLVMLAALAQHRPSNAADTIAVATAQANDEAGNAEAENNAAQPPSDSQHKVAGVILDVAGNPVAGARVIWGAVQDNNYGVAARSDERYDAFDVFTEGVTDAQGQFALAADFDQHMYRFPSVVIRHKDHGLGLASYSMAEKRDPLKIYLPSLTPIEGQILNANGMPVEGAEVLPIHLQSLVRRLDKTEAEKEEKADPDKMAWGWIRLSDYARETGKRPSFWPQSVKTGPDGRFVIPATDNSGVLLLRVTADGYGPHGVTISDAEYLSAWKKNHQDNDDGPPLESKFTLVLESPRTIEGTITDSKTEKPIPGVQVVMESSRSVGHLWNHLVSRATSDEQGNYRLIAPATGREQHILMSPPLGYSSTAGRFFLEKEFAKLFSNSRVYRNDKRMIPGQILRGRVVDKESRAPIQHAAVLYRLGPKNSIKDTGDYLRYEPVLTNDQGEFQLTGYPGSGIITVNGLADKYVRTVLPQPFAANEAQVSPHAFAVLDLPEEGPYEPIELEVHSGIDLVIDPVTENGEAISSIVVASRESGTPPTQSFRGKRTKDLPIHLPGCEPGKTYRVSVASKDAHWGAIADVTCQETNEPVKVTLQPTGSLRGKLVYSDGSPASDVHIFLHFHDNPASIEKLQGMLSPLGAGRFALQRAQNLPYYNNILPYHKGSKSTTDENGEFEMLGMMPGVFLYLTVNYDFESGERHYPAGVIEAGKATDLGATRDQAKLMSTTMLLNEPGAAWQAFEPSPAEPWDAARVAHLHRRAGFGASWDQITRDMHEGLEPSLARVLKGEEHGPDGRTAAEYAALATAMDSSFDSGPSLSRLQTVWLFRILHTPFPLEEKMTLVWHSHFATSFDKTGAVVLAAQNRTQRELWRAPISQLHLRMLRDPAMLAWLDGVNSTKAQPNENLGREFLELFSLGEGNYTEQDVKETARALTGWQRLADGDMLKMLPGRHDAGSKTVLGKTGNWADEDIVRIACEQPAAARHIARRLWRTFIADTVEPGPELLEALAATMRMPGDVDVAKGIETILRSQLFHSEECRAWRVASPVEYVACALRSCEAVTPSPDLLDLNLLLLRMGQSLFQPPNVAGWPGGLEWLRGPTIVARSNFAAWIVDGSSGIAPTHYRSLAKRHGWERPDDWVDHFSLLLAAVPISSHERSAILAAAGVIADPSKACAEIVNRTLGSPAAQLC